MSAAAPTVRTAQVWVSATRGRRDVSRPNAVPRTSFVDVAVVICFLALIGIAVLGGALMLLSRISAILPVSSSVPCPDIGACTVTAADNEAVPVDDDWIYGPKLTP